MGRKKGHAGRNRGFSEQPDGRPVERAKTANIPSGQALEVSLIATNCFESAVRPLGMASLVCSSGMEHHMGSQLLGVSQTAAARIMEMPFPSSVCTYRSTLRCVSSKCNHIHGLQGNLS